MVRKSILIAVALIVVASAEGAAAALRQVPPVATNETPVTMVISDNGCGFWGPAVSRNGPEIEIRIAGQGCVTGTWPFEIPVPLGTLPPGDHVVKVLIEDEVAWQTTVVVHDVTTFPLVPSGAQLPGTFDFVHFPIGISELTNDAVVRFGPDASPQVTRSIYLPAHAAEGPVDVTVVHQGMTAVARNGFTWTSRGCTDPRIWERVLVPIEFNGPGANGSQWVTRFNVAVKAIARYHPWIQVPRRGEPCSMEQADPSRPKYVSSKDDGQRGYFVWVPRTLVPALAFSLTVQETSNNANAIPVAIPVLPERDWKFGTSTISVPAVRNARATLRIYGLDDDFHGAWVTNARLDLRGVGLLRYGADEPMFVAMDVTSMLDPDEPTLLQIDGGPMHSRYWAMLTVTDNVTQRFAVFTPQ
jgi:hypothetical protein